MSKPRPALAKTFRPKLLKVRAAKKQPGIPHGPHEQPVKNRIRIYTRRALRGEPLSQNDPALFDTSAATETDTLLADGSFHAADSLSAER
jgi:hypothetical protein